VLTRLLALVGVVFIVTIFCFLLVQILPGNAAVEILGTSANPQSIAKLNAQLGLDRPLVVQYLIWLNHIVHLQFGTSPVTGEAIGPTMARAFKLDFEIVIYSQVLALGAAVPLSVYSARRSGGALDQSATATTFAFYCLPAFIVILWLYRFLVQEWNIFPAAGANPFPTGGSLPSEVFGNLEVLFLPALVVAVGSLAIYYRLLRTEMGATLQEEFIAVARAKGLGTNRILWRHALRPSSIVVLTSMGNTIALLLTGLLVVEDKMGLDTGAGYILVQAISEHDYLLIQSMVLVIAIVVVAVNFVIDILTTFIDPRIARA
jgi:peptide/nickel transport system permease protein